ILEQTVDALHKRHPTHQRQLPRPISAIRFGDYIGRTALEQRELGHLRLNLRHELNGAGARTNHRHALTAQINTMVPARRMKTRARKTLQSWNLRICRTVELATGTDERLRAKGFAIGAAHLPVAAGRVEGCFADFATKT